MYDDVRMAAKCGPDIIYLDGAEGSTGAGPHIATEETGIPLMAAIPEARRALEDVGLADEIDLVVAGDAEQDQLSQEQEKKNFFKLPVEYSYLVPGLNRSVSSLKIDSPSITFL